MKDNQTIHGNARVCGDDIDTDRIIPGKYTKTVDRDLLARHVFEDLFPKFTPELSAGNIVVAGSNFGCGSSREQAPLAIKSRGVSLVIARSFARIFYRNSINIGLPILEIPDHDIAEGEALQVQLSTGLVQVVRDNGRQFEATPLPLMAIEISRAGGLVSYLKQHGDFCHG